MSEAIELDVSNFNIVLAVLGGFLSIYGLVSYLAKDRLFLSEALIAVIAGLILSPHAANFIKPLDYARGSQANLNEIILYFSRLALDIQLVIAGIQLPHKYLKTEWKSLAILLGPGMCAMWISTSLLVWAMVPNFSFLHSLAVAACVTPTDPVLSNGIVKGKFADKNIPKDLQDIIVAESGANDGLGYPFLFLALYLIRYTGDDGLGQHGGAKKALGYWFAVTWAYVIIMSVVYGAVIAYLFRVALKYAERKKWVDRESFLVFAVSLALFIGGTGGMIGTDDVLASFIAGNVFTWDDWFRKETADDSFQSTIDMLINVAIFIWYGAVCPWYMFAHNNVIPIYRLIFLGILVMIFRRIPFVQAVHHYIWQIEDRRRNFFTGFFGPIGVSAIFYLYVSVDYLDAIQVNGQTRPDAAQTSEVTMVVVWFMVMTSIIVHGLSIPLAKVFAFVPRTISRSNTMRSATFRLGKQATSKDIELENGLPHTTHRTKTAGREEPLSPVFRIGNPIIPNKNATDQTDNSPPSESVTRSSGGREEKGV